MVLNKCAMAENSEVSSSLVKAHNIFTTAENRPMEFHVYPSVDSDHLIQLIKDNGGEIVCADHPRAIRVGTRKGLLRNEFTVSASFIYASCLEKKLLDLNSFRLHSDQLPSTVLFGSLLDSIEDVIEKFPEKLVNRIIRHISLAESLWKDMANYEDFKGSTASELRNTFNIWAFLSLRRDKSKYNSLLRDLVKVVKKVAEECCGSSKKFEAFEHHLNSTQQERIDSKLVEEEANRSRTEICDEVGDKVQRLQRNGVAENAPTREKEVTEENFELVLSEEEDCVAGGETSREINCENRDFGEETSERCSVKRTGDVVNGAEMDSEVFENEDCVVTEEITVCKSKRIEETPWSSKSGVWLEKNAMKKFKREEEEVESETDVSSSADSESEVVIRKGFPMNRNYTFQEDMIIIKWVLKTRRSPFTVSGNQLWKHFEKKKVLPNRSWQSMKERFKRHISKNLTKYHLSDVEMKRIKKLL